MTHRLPIACIALSGLLLLPATRPVHAAQSYDGCAGFIDALPATISTQGVWCLRHDLATNIGGGAAITIAANNVTIDCNDFKIGGLAAGNGSQATGIHAINQQNATVRHCNVRGFMQGIALEGGSGHLIEDNRLDNNLTMGIYAPGDDNTVRRNRVYDTGGSSTGESASAAYGIMADGDIVDNVVDGVFANGYQDPTYGLQKTVTGIAVSYTQHDVLVRGNRITGLQAGLDSGSLRGLQAYVDGASIRIEDNHVSTSAYAVGTGIRMEFNTQAYCIGNSVTPRFATGYVGCDYSSGNL